MNNQPNTGRGCIRLLSLVVFMWGALMLFPKTADVLTHFAPNEFLGFTDMAQWWAIGSAALVEGVMVIMKIKTWIAPAATLMEWAWDVVLSFTPFILSAAFQVVDGMLVRGNLKDQPDQMQLLITYLVPALPAVMIGLLLVYALIESAPAELFGGMRVGNGSAGVGNPFTAVRDGVYKLIDWVKQKPGGQPKVNPTPQPTQKKQP